MQRYLIIGSMLLCLSCQPQESRVSEQVQPDVEPKVTPALSDESPPIQRVVAFKFKEDASEEAIQAHMKYFESLQDSIPQILSYRAGETFPAAYENTGDYDVLHYTTFESEKAIEEYFNHPAHQRFIEVNKDSWANVIVLNSQVRE